MAKTYGLRSFELATPQEEAEAEQALHRQRVMTLTGWQCELEAMLDRIRKLLDAIDEFEHALA